MKKAQMALTWQGIFVELCMGRVNAAQRVRIETLLSASAADYGTLWYDNPFLLKSLFAVDNWWSIDDLDHSMGLCFADRAALESQMKAIRYTLNGESVTVDPDALQLSFYNPERMEGAWEADERIFCHGIRRQATLHLTAEIDPPFDPSLITLSLITFPDYGSILIDLDYDGHDEFWFTWGETTYLKPRFFEKDYFHDTTG